MKIITKYETDPLSKVHPGVSGRAKSLSRNDKKFALAFLLPKLENYLERQLEGLKKKSVYGQKVSMTYKVDVVL